MATMKLFHVWRFESSDKYDRPIHIRVDDIQAVAPSSLAGCVIWLRGRENEITLTEVKDEVLTAIEENDTKMEARSDR